MGEISEALERARQEEAQRRGARRERQTADVEKSLQRAAVERALREAEGAPDLDDLPLSPLDDDLEVGPRESLREEVELRPTSGSILTASSESIEHCRHLANRVSTEMERRSLHTLALVSALRGEGKSTVSSNIALAAATLSQGRSVALVDLDLRRPTIAEKLGLEVEVGMEEVLEGKADLDEARIPVGRPQIDVYAAQPSHTPAHELIVLPHFRRTIEDLRERYRLVVFDTPPVLLVPDASLMLKHVEACLVVARMGITRARSVRQMIELLPREKLIGSLLNATDAPKQAGDYYGYYTARPDAEVEVTE